MVSMHPKHLRVVMAMLAPVLEVAMLEVVMAAAVMAAAAVVAVSISPAA